VTTEDPPETTELNFEMQSRRCRQEVAKWVEALNDVGCAREEIVVPAAVQIVTEIFVSTRPHAGILAPMSPEGL